MLYAERRIASGEFKTMTIKVIDGDEDALVWDRTVFLAWCGQDKYLSQTKSCCVLHRRELTDRSIHKYTTGGCYPGAFLSALLARPNKISKD